MLGYFVSYESVQLLSNFVISRTHSLRSTMISLLVDMFIAGRGEQIQLNHQSLFIHHTMLPLTVLRYGVSIYAMLSMYCFLCFSTKINPPLPIVVPYPHLANCPPPRNQATTPGTHFFSSPSPSFSQCSPYHRAPPRQSRQLPKTSSPRYSTKPPY